jgi:hypothetical protein
MAEYWVDPANGSDANAGTLAAPWQRIPGQTGANAVVAGDIINVRNGTVSTLRLVLPANDLTYRGYGLADNVLYLTLPSVRNPAALERHRVVREPGVHEGMWTLNAAGNDTDGMLNYFTRTGCVIEDVAVVGSDVALRPPVRIGTTTQAQVGATLRRFLIQGSATIGMGVARPDTLIEWGKLDTIDGDAVTIVTTSTQGFHAGRWVRVQRCEMLDPGASEVLADGDALQLNNSAGFEGVLEMLGCYVRKPSTVKQAVMIANIKGRVTLRDNHFESESGSIAVGINGVAATGRVEVLRNAWRLRGEYVSLPLVRLVDPGGIADGGRLVVDHNAAEVGAAGGLFSIGPTSGSVAGAIDVTNNTYRGGGNTGLSWSATIGAYSATGGLASTARIRIQNNVVDGPAPSAIRMASADLNTERVVVSGNIVRGTTFAAGAGTVAGGTNYATMADFAAAHSGATANLDGDPRLAPSGRPLPGSPLLGSGIYKGCRPDITGRLSDGHIGAFGWPA